MTDVDWRLQDQRQFLRRSLEDARREHEAGDLTDEDYEVLRRRDEARLAGVEESIAERGEQPRPPGAVTAAAPGRGVRRRLWSARRRWWFVVTAVALVAAGALLLVHSLTAPLLPGQSVTGGIDLNAAQRIAQQLSQAKTLVRTGHPTEALRVYGQVLTEDPREPVALAEWGWLDWQAASKIRDATVAAEGASALEDAVTIDKRLFAAQYYLATVLLQEGAPKKAVAHFAQFLADRPTSSWLRQAAPELRLAYKAAHLPVPSGVPGG